MFRIARRRFQATARKQRLTLLTRVTIRWLPVRTNAAHRDTSEIPMGRTLRSRRRYSTVTDFARFRGLSTSNPRATAT
jgi:hypothetical protein